LGKSLLWRWPNEHSDRRLGRDRPLQGIRLSGCLHITTETANLARTLKAERGLASRRDTKFLMKADDAQWAIVESNLSKITRMIGAAEIVRQDNVDGAPAVVTPLGTLALDLAANLDVGAEEVRLAKELETLARHIAGTESRLANKAFTDKAPPAVIDGARKQLADQITKRDELTRLLQALS